MVDFFRRRCLTIIKRFGDACLGFYRHGTRLWFIEFVFKFWGQCYLLLIRALIPKLRSVFIEEFNCFPPQNGNVNDFYNHATL